MWNRFLTFFKAFFISIELFLLIGCVVFWILDLDLLFSKIGLLLFNSINLELIVGQFALPTGLITLSYTQVKYLLQPEMKLKDFYTWSDFHKLKITCLAGLLWNVLALISPIIIICLPESTDLVTKGAIYVSLIVPSIYSTISLLFARQRIKELIETNQQQ